MQDQKKPKNLREKFFERSKSLETIKIREIEDKVKVIFDNIIKEIETHIENTAEFCYIYKSGVSKDILNKVKIMLENEGLKVYIYQNKDHDIIFKPNKLEIYWE